MADFWLISVPLDKTTSASVEKLKRAITKAQLCSNWKFSIPDLKVGVLDSLLSVSDNFSKLDTLTESVIKKTCQCMNEVMEPSEDKVHPNILVNGEPSRNQSNVPAQLKAYLTSLRVNMMKYVTKFQWDTAKYPPALPLSSLVDIIGKEVLQAETEFKSHASAYNSLKANLEHKLNEKLQTRSLHGIVSEDDFVVSEYLTTLLVVVSRDRYLQWERSYESLSLLVVPRSSRKLFEDGEGAVFSVTLFKRVVCEFKAKAQESKFIVREYCFDQEAREQQEIREYTILKREKYEIFVRWLMVNFSQLFIAWIHLKAIGVFVESVLRYGLPVNYQALLLQTDKKHSKKLRDTLSSLFKHLDPTASLKDVSCDIPGLCQEEYSSYICFPINTSML
ncbi:V-type proton ATPase subunit C 1-B-like [Oryzias latipes]|uniref:V-type proton ATPase subunit C n=1 Tax=Oryzias latipes TaxID=8090 RepID=A0A3B3HHG7_ORYLA|nr:V-type proton ATPase subunit C 1-B-like [Oryzias latipes]